MVSQKLIGQLTKILATVPTEWDGRQAILTLRQANYHWRQMEWIGFYFQFLCRAKLSSIMEISGPRYGRVEFDGFSAIPWDFKVHPNKDADGRDKKDVIVNDRLAIGWAVKKFGAAGLILASGAADYNDEDRSFQIWHKELKGGLSNYEKQRISRRARSRLRKTAFRLDKIDLILLDDEMLKRHRSFQEGFRNSDGSPRKAKLLLDLEKIVPVETINFLK